MPPCLAPCLAPAFVTDALEAVGFGRPVCLPAVPKDACLLTSSRPEAWPRCLQRMGDKTQARAAAEECGVPVVPGTKAAISSAEQALDFARAAGLPVMLKAAYGGGGRGMRVVRAGAPPILAPAVPAMMEQKRTPADKSLGMTSMDIVDISGGIHNHSALPRM